MWTRIKALLATQGLKLARIGGLRLGSSVWVSFGAGTARPLGGMAAARSGAGGRAAGGGGRAACRAPKAERDRLVREGREAAAVKARELARLGAIASESSFVFATELFGWRTFANRRQLAGSVGLTGTPYNSGAERPRAGHLQGRQQAHAHDAGGDRLVLAQISAHERAVRAGGGNG